MSYGHFPSFSRHCEMFLWLKLLVLVLLQLQNTSASSLWRSSRPMSTRCTRTETKGMRRSTRWVGLSTPVLCCWLHKLRHVHTVFEVCTLACMCTACVSLCLLPCIQLFRTDLVNTAKAALVIPEKNRYGNIFACESNLLCVAMTGHVSTHGRVIHN